MRQLFIISPEDLNSTFKEISEFEEITELILNIKKKKKVKLFKPDTLIGGF